MVSSRAIVSGWWLASYVVLWALVISLSILLLALARQVGVLHLRLGPRGALEIDEEGPPLGEAPEPTDARALDGTEVTIGGPGEPQLLFFVSPGCPVCRQVLPSLAPAARAARMTPLAVVDVEERAARDAYEHSPPTVRMVASPELTERYAIPGTPYAVVLDAIGVVRAKGTVNNLEQIEGLVDTARRRLEESVS
jgi:methylamine dehydrogenase accessory protein MauD